MTDEAPITVTLKADGGAPWVVIRGNTANDIKTTIDQLADTGTLGEIVVNNAAFAAVFNTNHGLKGVPERVEHPAPTGPTSPAPRASAAPAPAVVGPVCQHGQMQFRTGVSKKTNKAWKAWMCPTASGTPGQCEPQFIYD